MDTGEVGGTHTQRTPLTGGGGAGGKAKGVTPNESAKEKGGRKDS